MATKSKPTYQELESRIKELESSQSKTDIIDFKNLKDLKNINRTWIETSPVCTKIVDLDFNLQYMSEAGIKQLKIEDITEYYGKKYPLHFYPNSFKISMTKNLKRAKESRIIVKQESDIVDVQGNKLWYHSTIVPIDNANGQLYYFMVVSVDITEQKNKELESEKEKEKAQKNTKKNKEKISQLFETTHVQEKKILIQKENLEKSEEKYKALYNNAPLSYQSLDINGNLIDVNPAWLSTLGYSIDEVKGKWFGDFLHPDSIEFFKLKFPKFKKEENVNNIQFRIRHKDGNYLFISFEGRSGYNPDGSFKLTYCTFRDITSQKIAEQKLAQSEERFSQIIENSKDWIWEMNEKGLYTYASNKVEEILHYKPEELVGKKYFYDFFKEDKKEKLKKITFEIFKQKKHFLDFENINVDKNGDLVWISTSGVPIIDSKGNLTGYSGVDRNITKIKKNVIELNQAKKIAEASNANITAIIEGTNNSIWAFDQNYDILYTNQIFKKEFQNTFGVRLDQGVNLIEALPEELRPFWKTRYDKVLRNEQFTVVDAIDTVNGKIYIEITFNPIIKDSKVVGGTCLGSDITERKLSELELKESKEKALEGQESYKALFESIGDAIYIQDYDAKFIDVNNGVLNMYGYSKKELIGNTPTFLSAPNMTDMSAVFESFNKVKQGAPQLFEFWGKRKNGEIFPKTVGQYKGRYFGQDVVITVARDISERIQTEKKLFKAKEKAEESDRLKTEFLNNMSHEIRTPMNGILGFSEMLGNPDISEVKRTNFVQIIQSSGKQLLKIIDDILEISRLGTKQVKVVEEKICLNDLMYELFSIFDIKAKENKTPLYLKNELSDKQSTILIDSTKMNKILSNLLENALKFTSNGFIEFGYLLKNNELELYVKDTGIGIEKAKQNIIFERFSQAEKELSKKVGGLGLGLSIAKENAELLGGHIKLESKKGEGAAFFVTIPYNPVYKHHKITIESADTQQEYTILIPEDEEVNYLYFETLLKDVIGLNCKIIHVINGKEAVEICKKNKTIDLVLMDLKMPLMNGFEATKQIKEFWPSLPIIAQTAYSTAEEKKQANLVGCNDFISKPISKETLKLILDKYLVKELKS